MKPVFLDLHIHTSEDPTKLNSDYDLKLLNEKISAFTGGNEYLISLTDHNTINKEAYLKSKGIIENILVGVELHIRNYKECPSYHCHAYFKDCDNEDSIDKLNEILDRLYKIKKPSDQDDIPGIEDIIRNFDGFEFMLLPHGGQSHRTFDDSIPDGVKFDDTLSKSIYYNQFDGFTARGINGLEKTREYFKRLNINEFVNLMTCTDNYNPKIYPDCKAKDANEFVPTWMFSAPTFDGLRLALSESSRLRYSSDPPIFEHNHIKEVKLSNDKIDIDVKLSPGLNVVIGESSSGKTLFVDSLYKKITGNFDSSEYLEFGVNDIIVSNPSGSVPHFLSQNYIMSIVSEANGDLNKIAIVKDVFPGDADLKIEIEQGLSKLRNDLSELISAVKEIEKITKALGHLPNLQNLIVTESLKGNIFKEMVPLNSVTSKLEFNAGERKVFIENLKAIENKLVSNPLVENNETAFSLIRNLIETAFENSKIEKTIRSIIKQSHDTLEEELMTSQRLDRAKLTDFDKLLTNINEYALNYNKFKLAVKRISEYSTSCETQAVESEGHQLFIKNDFSLNKTKVKDVINELLKSGFRISDLDELEPEFLFEANFSERPKVAGYDEFERKVNSKFESFNSKKYQIITKDGRDFSQLSPGWKTSIILDIILGYKDDMAPIIIDQPEDNLAISYINAGLVKAIKNIKELKQIILVSHNATIPMMGDAQTIVLCQFEKEKLKIRSARLEDEIDGKSIVGHIADLTDGGKASIKKRVKKYNLKNFKS